MNRNSTLLECHGLATGYGHGLLRRTVTCGVNCSLAKGTFTAFLGANGTGKSTLLRTLAGLQPPLEGYVEIDGLRVDRCRPKELARLVSVVMTSAKGASGGLTAAETVAMGRHPYTGVTGRLNEYDRAVVESALDRVGVTHLASRHIASLSDGERQKVMIAKALAQEAPLMVLDEPTAFLDAASRVETLSLLSSLARNDARTILLSTHDIGLIMDVTDNLWLLMPGGELVDGRPEVLVSNGEVGRMFAGRGVRFDPERGDFVAMELDKS